jgi:hypothetical protein
MVYNERRQNELLAVKTTVSARMNNDGENEFQLNSKIAMSYWQ